MDISDQPDPWIPDQPTTPLYVCAHCGAYPLAEPICVACYNALIIALRNDVTVGDLSDFVDPDTGRIIFNHRGRLFDWRFVQFTIDNKAHIPYSTIVHLIIARAVRNGDL